MEDKPKEPEILEPEIDKAIDRFDGRGKLEHPPAEMISFLSVVELAIKNKYDPAIIKQMMDLRDREDKKISEKAFFQSFSAFKKEEVKVLTDRINDLFDSGYSSVGNFLNTVNPFLGKHDMSANFEIDDTTDGQRIKVTCFLYHVDGHSLKSGMSASPDTKGPKGGDVKTEIHGRLSSVTHLMRATFSAVTGIAAIDGRFDDDGNFASGIAYITEDKAKSIHALIKETKINESILLKTVKAETVETIPELKFKQAMAILQARKKQATNITDSKKESTKKVHKK